MPDTILKLDDIRKRFGATVALDGVNLQLRRGEVHALIGENGAGKSTLMNTLAGALKPDVGRMEINGAAYAPTSPLDARRRGIALIHQELSLCPHLSVAENILLGLENSRLGWLDRKRLHERAQSVLNDFQHPEIRPERKTGELPIAARQVVEICRALAAQASIILMDEPTSSLPREDAARLFALIRKLRAQGLSIIYISHFLEEIREIADNYTVLRDGRSVATGSLGATDDAQLIAQMVGRAVENLFPSRERNGDGAMLLEVKNLSAPPVVREASFTLRRGEILGIAGLMGSGRSETVRALFGLDGAASGSVKIRGREMPLTGAPDERLRAGFGYLSEDRKGEGLALTLSLADNITLTNLASCARWGWLNLRRQTAQAATQIANVGVKARDARQAVNTLSGGNQQKVAIARLLHQDADILLLDEPTRGIDIGSKAQVYETIARAAANGKAVLFVSSYLPELFGMCDRLAVMSRGVLSEARNIEEWTPETVLQHALGAKN